MASERWEVASAPSRPRDRSSGARLPWRSRALLVSVGSLWGATFPLTRYLTGYVDPLWMVLGRLVVGSLALLAAVQVVSLLRGHRTGPRTWVHLAVAGVLNIAIPWCLMAIVLQAVAASVVTMFFAGVGPLLTFVVGVLARRERWRVGRAVGLLVSLLGIVTVSTGATARAATPLHLAALGLAVLTISIGAVYVATHLHHVAPATVALGQLLAATAVVAAASLLSGHAVLLAPMTTASWIVWGTLGVANTALTYLLFFLLLLQEGPVTAAAANYVTVCVGVAAGLLVLAEPLTWSLLLGGILVLVGMGMSTRRGGSLPVGRPRPPPPGGTPRPGAGLLPTERDTWKGIGR